MLARRRRAASPESLRVNFLAHLLLAGDETEARVGNFLADFVKGRARTELSPGVQRGIACHRAIDAFTDTHAIVAASQARLGAGRRRLAGVLVDVFYDHLLTRDWDRYATTPLSPFAAGIYAAFDGYAGPLPAPARGAMRRMAQDDWLGSYATLAGIELAFARIERRLGMPGLLAGAVDELETLRPVLADDFAAFFPQLAQHANAWTRAHRP